MVHTPRWLIEQVSRAAVGDAPPRRTLPLTLDQLNPVIRIAHQQVGSLRIGPRIILDHELVHIVAGSGRMVIAGQAHRFAAGQAWFIEPHVPHEIHSDPGAATEHVAVHFDLAPGFPLFPGNVDRRPPYQVRLSHGMSLPLCVALRRTGQVARWIGELPELRQRGDALSELKARHLLRGILLALLSGGDASDASAASSAILATHPGLRRALDHLRTQYHRELGVPELAAVAGLSVTHFSRLFRQWTGQSPAQALRQTRINIARQLLADPELSIKQIALRLGFKDPYHFSKVFRQIDGLSPSQYRDALRP